MKQALALLLFVSALDARAADTWTTPFPGVRLLHRTGAGNLNVYLATVDLCAAGVSLRATGHSERGQRTSTFATSVGAQLAINGDFSCRTIDTLPGSPFPPCLGRPVYTTYGSAAHAGVAWPQTISLDALLAVGADRVQIFDDDENQPIQPWMSEAVGGHWSIVRNGVLLPNDCPIDPRSAVGLSADRNLLLLGVADGRGSYRGMTCLEMAQLMIDHGADRAFALDSGGSSTMWLQGAGVVNHPSDGSERVVGNHIAVLAPGTGSPQSCTQQPPVVNPSAMIPVAATVGSPGRLSVFPPRRLFDTRLPALSAGLLGLMRDANDRVAGQTSFSLIGEPSATSLVFHVTADDSTMPGFVTTWPQGAPMPNASMLNQAPLRTVANTTIVPQGAGGSVSVFTSGPTHLIGDAVAAFGPLGTSGYLPLAPTRVLDTRSEPSSGLAANVPRTIIPAGAPSVEALAVNVTAIASASPGFVSLFACGTPIPPTSALNFAPGQVVAGFSFARTGPSGLCAVSTADTHVIVDLVGRFEAGGALYQALTPTRWIDTRSPGGPWSGRTARSQPLEVSIRAGLPAGARAVALTLTATGALEPGFVTLYPCSQPTPGVSNVNYGFGQTVANSAVVDVGDGRLCLLSSGRTHVILDVIGAFVPPPDAGVPIVDAGLALDSGTIVDAGTIADAGVAVDSGTVTDAGTIVDAGTPVDAGTVVDAGSTSGDAGTPSPDAGSTRVDAGVDAGTNQQGQLPGCGCSSFPSAAWLLSLLVLRWRRNA